MKGIELPINILIIIAIAIIVLIALIAMFYPAFAGGSAIMNSETAKTRLCQIMVEAKKCNVNSNTITISDFDADRDGSNDGGSTWVFGVGGSPCADATGTGQDNLASLCKCYYSVDAEVTCKKMCGCG